MDPITGSVKVSIWKTLSYVPVVGVSVQICDLLHIDCNLISILFVMMIIDFGTGWYKSIRLGIPITIKRVKAGFFAKMAVFGLILAVGLMILSLEIVNHNVAEYFNIYIYLKYMIFVLILNEFYSILGNILSGREQKPVMEIDFISLVILRIRGKIEDNFESAIDKLEKETGNIKG